MYLKFILPFLAVIFYFQWLASSKIACGRNWDSVELYDT